MIEPARTIARFGTGPCRPPARSVEPSQAGSTLAVRFATVAALLLSVGCTRAEQASRPDAAPAATADASHSGGECTMLFGRPSEKTGVGADRCRPECTCGGERFAPPEYDAAFIRTLIDGWHLTTPYAPITTDPYAGPPPADDSPGTVCAVLPQGAAGPAPRGYELATYPSESAARAVGAKPTHFGRCGVCSTLANLAVYMSLNDMTAPVRTCGLAGITDGGDANVACLRALGFDLPCAQAWYYDTVHTRSVCLQTCLTELDKPYQLPDGGLNPCLRCDEVESGPVFKVVAGRTRRNSGLPNALCRPCSEVRPLVHVY
jgi:hypothetical protein